MLAMRPPLGRRELVLHSAAAALGVLGPKLPAARAQPAGGPLPQLALRIDATDVQRGIFVVEEQLRVTGPGPLTLYFPQWIPGTHSATGPVHTLAGLDITAAGQPLAWQRDPLNPFAFHIVVPEGAEVLRIGFRQLTPRSGAEGAVVVSANMLMLHWTRVLLYPAGIPAADILVQASLMLPTGWQCGTALDPVAAIGDRIAFKPVSLLQLADSPVLAGRHTRRIPLGEAPANPVELFIAAERPDQMHPSAEQIAAHRKLVAEAGQLFGAHHYGRYDFLLALTDRLGRSGIEHHQSSENITTHEYFKDWAKTAAGRDLLPHEYTHSWNGKYRRPAGHDRTDFNAALENRLLWVYEGLTQYWGWVLAARAGLWAAEFARAAIASSAARQDVRPGRQWRPLEDTTLQPVIRYRGAETWASYQRAEDYYEEGALIWLEADTLLRQDSAGRLSLDDFARGFFGIEPGRLGPNFYTFDDVVAALDRLLPMDWRGFFIARVRNTTPRAPLAGLLRGGYRLTFAEAPSEYSRTAEQANRFTDLTYSLGISLDNEGIITAVLWDGPAFRQGLTRGMRLIAVNGEAYGADLLKAAVTAAKGSSDPIELLVRDGARFNPVRIAYHDGLRYPVLQRDATVPALLDTILAPRG